MSVNQAPPTGGQSRGGAAPGSQNQRNNSAAAAAELTKMLGQELMAAGKAILAQDPRAFALSQTKLRQIEQAATAIGGPQSPPQPQGPQTGVAQPIARPVDAITGQGVQSTPPNTPF